MTGNNGAKQFYSSKGYVVIQKVASMNKFEVLRFEKILLPQQQQLQPSGKVPTRHKSRKE